MTACDDAAASADAIGKVVFVVADAQTARRVAAGLQELIDPPADAVASFEDPRGWRIDAYFRQVPDPGHLSDQLGALMEVTISPASVERVPDENWVSLSQAALPPVVAGRFTVHGRHDRARVPRGPLHIEVDAGEAFGTAHHATTEGCLIAIDALMRRRQHRRVLDLGCGSGVLAIAAQRLTPGAAVIASDIDPVAVGVAAANARANGAVGIECLLANGVPSTRRNSRGSYDLVIANILAGPLIVLAPRVRDAVTPGGWLVLSGLLTVQSREVLGAYLTRGFRLERRIHIAGWTTLVLQSTIQRPIHRS
ncbi:MAG: 50S ribosomal protein L11 methyltransferase [Hyphomicrobiaceae bacterium]